jgi:hypothetical protein
MGEAAVGCLFLHGNSSAGHFNPLWRSAMLQKPGARMLVLLVSVTILNVAILLVNLSFPSRAAVANMDYHALVADADFKQAVQAIVQACIVNVDIAKVRC